MTRIVARRMLSKKKSQLLFRCSAREFTDSMDRLRALHLFFEPKIPQEFARTMGSLSSHAVDNNENDTAVPMELPDDEDEEKKQDKTRVELMSKFGDLNVEENAQRALDFVAAMWWWLPRNSNSLMPPHLSAEDTLRRFLRCFQRVPPNTWETPQILERVMRVHSNNRSIRNNNSFVDEFLDPEDSNSIPRDAHIAALMTENSRMAKKLYSIERDHMKHSHRLVNKEIELHGRERRDEEKTKELEQKYDSEVRRQKHLLNRDFELSLREREDEKVERNLKRREKELEDLFHEKVEEEKRSQRRLLNRDLVLSQRERRETERERRETERERRETEREKRETEREKRQREVKKITKKSKGVSSDKRRDRLKDLGIDMNEEVELTEKALLDIANEVAQVTVRVDADLKYVFEYLIFFSRFKDNTQITIFSSCLSLITHTRKSLQPDTTTLEHTHRYISSHVKESFRSRISKSVDKIKDTTHRNLAAPHVKQPAFISGPLEQLRSKLIGSLDMLECAFNTIDSTGDGKLTMEEFNLGLREAVENITPSEIRVAHKIVDDPSGFVDHFGFITMIRELKDGD